MVRRLARRLADNGIEDSLFEARQLIEFISGRPAEISILSEGQQSRLCEIVNKRITGYPLQYILGQWEFYSLPFKIRENVLIPRCDTETLIDACRGLISDSSSVLDLCCGSGCIGITLNKLTNAQVTCIDISSDAVSLTEENARLNNARISIFNEDVFKYHEKLKDKSFDLIVSNPPYLTKEDMENLQREVSFEPALALYGGETGLDFYKSISKNYYGILKSKGVLAFEIGSTQGKDLCDILEELYTNIKIFKDSAGNDRVVTAEKRD